MNALEQYRKTHELTFEALGKAAGYDKGNAYKHCQADPIPDSAVLRYHRAYGIPLSDLRPDLFTSPDAPQPPEAA